MPILYSDYPPNWNETRIRVLIRAKYCCENCGIGNYQLVHSFKENNVTTWRWLDYGEWIRLACPKEVKVVLTIAHLDHDEKNHDVKDERLKALCQLCHLRYDAPEKARRRREKHSL